MTDVPLLKPRPLSKNDTIAVVAPASAPLDASTLEGGIRYLRDLGYRVETGRSTYGGYGYLSGSDAERLDELNAALRREDVSVIFCVRGGYGTLRLLPEIDFEAARRHPKLVVGYSDITALQFALLQRAGLTSVAGAMVAVDWRDPDPPTEEHFWRVMAGEAPMSLGGLGESSLRPMNPGASEGRLIGGNLTLITRLLGTPYLPDLEGAILFFEEVGEAPYRLDGLFAHLKLAGVFERVAGVVVGDITEADVQPGRPSLSVEEVLTHYLAPLRCPVATGLRFGHVREKVTIPIGVRARLTVDKAGAELQVLEPAIHL